MVVSYVLMTGTGVFTARLLGPAAKGQLAAVTTWAQTVTWVATLGLNTALAVRVAESRAGPAGARHLQIALGSSLLYSAVAGSAVSLVSIAVLTRSLAGLGEGTAALVFLAFLGLPAGILVSVLMAIQLSLGRHRVFAMAQAAGPGAALLVVLAKYLVFGNLSPRDVVTAGLASSGLVMVVLIRSLPWRSGIIHTRSLYDDLRFGATTAVGGIFSVLNLRLDLVVLSLVVPSISIGYYSAANSFMAPVLVIPVAVAAHLTPKVAAAPPGTRSTATIVRQAVVGAAISAAAGLGVAIVSPAVVPMLLGSQYLPAVRLIWILFPGFVARGFVTVIVAGAVGQRRPRVGNYAEMWGVAVTVTALPLALARFGIIGAAAVSTVAYGVAAGTSLWLLVRSSGVRDSSVEAAQTVVGPCVPEQRV